MGMVVCTVSSVGPVAWSQEEQEPWDGIFYHFQTFQESMGAFFVFSNELTLD